MKNLFTRNNLTTAGISLILLGSSANKIAAQDSRSVFKKDFPKTLVARAGANSDLNSKSLSLLEIDNYAESQEVADITMDTIISNLIRNNKELAPLRKTKKISKSYRMAVKKIAGSDAPVGLHCMRLTFEGVMSGIDALGVEPKIISDGAKNACIAFRNDWKKSFPQDNYANLWYENANVYKNYDELITAAEKYINLNKPKDDAEKENLLKEFRKKNVYIDDLNGSVFLTPRGKGRFHATFYPGKMKKDNNNYQLSSDGKSMIISFNREYIGDIFGDTTVKNISFIANVNSGIQTKVFEESNSKIKNMGRADLIKYLSENANNSDDLKKILNSMPDRALVNLALAKYFGKDFEKNPPIQKIINPQQNILRNNNQNTL